jgi:signal transduction histidine kinase
MLHNFRTARTNESPAYSTDRIPLFTEVDEHKLQTVFVNILGNAQDAINSEGEIHISTSRRIRETVTMLAGSEVIAIQFTDNGEGIPEEHLSKIFDPFFTTKTRKWDGTGAFPVPPHY